MVYLTTTNNMYFVWFGLFRERPCAYFLSFSLFLSTTYLLLTTHLSLANQIKVWEIWIRPDIGACNGAFEILDFCVFLRFEAFIYNALVLAMLCSAVQCSAVECSGM